MLSPIYGIFDNIKNPILSITEAIDGIPLDLTAFLYQAKKFVDSVSGKKAIAVVPGMTPDMAAAIWMYTCESQLYKTLNMLLRARERNNLLPYFGYLRLVLEGMKKLSTGKQRMVNRGVKKNLVAENPDVYVKDRSLCWWQFSSTTANIAALSNPTFLGPSGDRTIFQILTKHGVDISAFSAVPGEAEVVLPPGICILITGLLPKDASGLTIITCEDDNEAPSMII